MPIKWKTFPDSRVAHFTERSLADALDLIGEVVHDGELVGEALARLSVKHPARGERYHCQVVLESNEVRVERERERKQRGAE